MKQPRAERDDVQRACDNIARVCEEKTQKWYEDMILWIVEDITSNPVWKKHPVDSKRLIAEVLANTVMFLNAECIGNIGADKWQETINRIHKAGHDLCERQEHEEHLAKALEELERQFTDKKKKTDQPDADK